LCDAIAVEYGAAGVLVVAVNDPQSRYSYPPSPLHVQRIVLMN